LRPCAEARGRNVSLPCPEDRNGRTRGKCIEFFNDIGRKQQASQNADNGDTFVGEIMAHYDLVLHAVKAGRVELVHLHRAHQISDETLHDLERDLDLEELSATAAKAL
jgi:hypothetical protein